MSAILQGLRSEGNPALPNPDCKAEIIGQHFNVEGSLDPPSFCTGCGRPYPWQATRVATAKALAEELDGLTTDQKLTLQAGIDDIAANTPRTELAVTRVKKLIAGLPGAVGEAVRKLVVDIASETATKLFKPGP